MIQVKTALYCIALAVCAACEEAHRDDLQDAQELGTRPADVDDELDAQDSQDSPEAEPQTGLDGGGDAASRDAAASTADTSFSPFSGVDARVDAEALAAVDARAALGDAGARALVLTFTPMYSAYDGQHVFKVPVRVERASGSLTVTTTPSGLVDSVATSYGLMLTVRQAGRVTVQVSDEAGNTASAPLSITHAGSSDYARGESLYRASLNPGPALDGGVSSNARSCASCHVAGSSTGSGGVEYFDVEPTPQQLAGHSDEDLAALLTQARKPPGAPFRVVSAGGLIPDSIAAQTFVRFHAWAFDESARRGLVTYLRGLEPRAQGGAVDFGGFLRTPAR